MTRTCNKCGTRIMTDYQGEMEEYGIFICSDCYDAWLNDGKSASTRCIHGGEKTTCKACIAKRGGEYHA